METVACLSCQAVNSAEQQACSNCGESLAAVKFQHSIDELKKVTDRLHELTAPRKTFSSFNGFGTTLLDYRPRPDGTYEAVRWIIAMGIPLVPLSAYVIQPTEQKNSYGQQVSSFQILDKIPLAATRILRTYLLVIIGLLPLVVGFFNTRMINHVLGGPLAFFAMLACIVWAVYIVFFRIKNDGKAYKGKTA